VDIIYEYLKKNLVENELVNLQFGDVPGCTYNAKITQVIINESDETSKQESEDKEKVKIEKEKESELRDAIKYRVKLVDKYGVELKPRKGRTEDVEYIVNATQIKRDRLMMSKMNIRKYIRDSATKEAWMGAPWLVKVKMKKKIFYLYFHFSPSLYLKPFTF